MTSDDRGRSSSPRERPWSAADSDRCECVFEVKSDDVLLGRGSGPNDHVGNIKFRDLVHERKSEYLSTNHRQTKALIAKDIVDQVYARGGRFLKKLSPADSAKHLPEMMARRRGDDPENDRSNEDDMDPGSNVSDIYQIQKHSTVMEKAKQALRQNHRNGSLDPPEDRSSSRTKDSRRGSMGQNSVSSDHQAQGMLQNNGNGNNNWGGIQNMAIPTTLNNTNHNCQRRHGGGFENNGSNNNNNAMREIFDMQKQGFNNSSSHNQNQNFQDQIYKQQQDLIDLQNQHDMLQQQMQYQQQRQQQQQQHRQYQSHHRERDQLLQEQLELQIRQEQLRMLQEQQMQNIANSISMYKKQQDNSNDQEQQQQQYRGSDQRSNNNHHHQSRNSPPSVLNGYATYTTTLDAIEDGRQNSGDGLAVPHDMMPNNNNNNDATNNASMSSVGNLSDPSKHHLDHHKFDEKSMQMSTMMGSFKDMSVAGDHSLHGSGDTIGTIDNIPSTLAGIGLSMVHMSGISIMSMMNDSTESLFKNQQKSGNVIGAKNASWGTQNNNCSSSNNHNGTTNSNSRPLADVVESTNPAAVAAAALLGKPIPGYEKAQRRWSGGFMPPTEISAVRRANRRGSLQYTSNNSSGGNSHCHSHNNHSNNHNQDSNTMAATAMLAMAAERNQHGHNYNQYNSHMNYSGGHDMMNPSNQGYIIDNGIYDGMDTGDYNRRFNNS